MRKADKRASVLLALSLTLMGSIIAIDRASWSLAATSTVPTHGDQRHRKHSDALDVVRETSDALDLHGCMIRGR